MKFVEAPDKKNYILENWNVFDRLKLYLIMNLKIEEYNEYPSNLDTFSVLKKKIWTDVTEKMSFLYEKEDKNFIDSFKKGKFNTLSTKNEKIRNHFLDLMILRNRVYENILLWLLENGNFNKLLTKNEINDLIVFLKSGISYQFDNGAKILENEYLKSNNKHIDKSKIQYAWLKDWEIKPYNEFIDVTKIDLSKMGDGYLKKYFTWFLSLIKDWETDYNKFVELEENEVKAWKDKKTITFTVPMENYHKPYLIDLWYEIHLSEFLDEEELDAMQDLSNKYFNSGFWMDRITLAFVEMLLTWGDNTFIQVLWRSFPNDEKLSNKFWKIIYIAKERNYTWARSAVETLSKLWINVDITIMKFIKLAEVKYHEFWHSLFKEDKPDSTVLEELKATLFYYLHLFDENLKIQPGYNELIWFIITEYIRRIPQKDNISSYQYWLLDSYIYNRAVKNGLIAIDNDQLLIQENQEWLNKFLEDMKTALFDIQKIYKINDYEKRKKAELKFVWKIFDENAKHEKFYKKILSL